MAEVCNVLHLRWGLCNLPNLPAPGYRLPEPKSCYWLGRWNGPCVKWQSLSDESQVIDPLVQPAPRMVIVAPKGASL